MIIDIKKNKVIDNKINDNSVDNVLICVILITICQNKWLIKEQ